ncbi:hypothetical protein CLF_111174 [Clonorchis sinensis]|uniref:Uncharacterized protein n=1 Tax=Clonorchis sinensis TaxID=79923 RepID=H2KT05_CLOSI|nr:hypothetical protein CLF_111174 [Clonorchis sinensis]
MESELTSYRSLQPIACLLTRDATYDPVNLAKVPVFIDTVASEISQRAECRNQVLLYSVLGRIPLEHTKTAILTACNMHDAACTARRLRKSKPSLCCPILMRLGDENDALRLLTSQALLYSTQTFQTVKVNAARA